MLYPIENRVREVKNLGGIWNFKIDRDNIGLEEKWYESPLRDAVPMAVPSSYNDLVTDEKDKEHVGYVWYETNFVIPASWNGKRVVLRFGSATHHAVCWLNGQEIIRHKGGKMKMKKLRTKRVIALIMSTVLILGLPSGNLGGCNNSPIFSSNDISESKTFNFSSCM